MSLGLTSCEMASATLVDSAEAGTQDDCSLSFTSASLVPRIPRPTVRMIVATATTHLVMGPVSLPATWRCMRTTLSGGTDIGIRSCRVRPRESQEFIGAPRRLRLDELLHPAYKAGRVLGRRRDLEVGDARLLV